MNIKSLKILFKLINWENYMAIFDRKLFCCLALAFSVPFGAQAATIGIHVVVDSAALKGRSQDVFKSNLDTLITSSNSFFSDSQVNERLYVTKVDFRDFTNGGANLNADTILNNMISQAGAFSGLNNEADKLGSDIVVAITPDGLNGSIGSLCGQASAIPTTVLGVVFTLRDNGRIVLNDACGTMDPMSPTLVHEIGHLMGLLHGAKAQECNRAAGSTTGGVYTFGRGFGIGPCAGPESAGWKDIMVHNYAPLLHQAPIFSNPRITNSVWCNVSPFKCGDETVGDASRALNLYVDTFAAREYPDVDQLAFKDNNLKACAVKYAGMEPNELTQIDCTSKGISDIAGMEQLTKLNNVMLGNNKIFRVASLMVLNNNSLQQIDLTGNPSVDCNELGNLMQLFPGKILAPKSCFSSASLPANLGMILL